MLNHLQLLRNVGRFDSVNSAANIALQGLTLIYAENGRGKTTLAAILRSLATGDAIPIVERRRLAAEHAPHVIVACAGGPPPAMFQNGAWNRTLSNMVVFDDTFIDKNVYSGLVVGVDHRQNLHELVLGAQGVALNERLQGLVEKNENHNRNLRQREAAIPAAERGGLTVDQYCALPENPDILNEIRTAEQRLAAAREQDPIRNNPLLDPLTFPRFDFEAIEDLLRAGLPELDAAAAARVQEHLQGIGTGAEEWIGQGIRRQALRSQESAGVCVFCAQNLEGSPVIAHYRAYFSDAYRSLQRRIAEMAEGFRRTHSDNAATVLERSVRILGERQQFWGQFADLLPVQIDTELIVRDWTEARDLLFSLIEEKRSAPLDPVVIPDELRVAISRHEASLERIASANSQLRENNRVIDAVKQSVINANPAALALALARLQAIRSRHTEAMNGLCEAYLSEKLAKTATERERDQARETLDQYRREVFPAYQAAMNRYLASFNAGFHLDNVTAANTRTGPTCTYNLVVNNTAVAVAGGSIQPGDHSFKDTLSAGDRNVLALAFFFASLELDPNLATKTVVIDDPVSSLDEHRSLTTVQEIRRLSARVSQVVVLSHSKAFLCRIWEGANTTTRVALQVVRDGEGSTIGLWDVNLDSITEHDRRSAALRNYRASGVGSVREIARAIRPHIEAFFRVAYPEYFPPSTLLGAFRGLCEQNVNSSRQILSAADIQELRDLIEYANRFHHDTNPAWESETINDGELSQFVNRTLSFAKRP